MLLKYRKRHCLKDMRGFLLYQANKVSNQEQVSRHALRNIKNLGLYLSSSFGG